MPNDIEKHHPKAEYNDDAAVQRKNHGCNGQEADFEQGLKRVKGKGSPGGRIVRKVVDAVDQREQFGLMHESVGPVKPGVMQDNHEDETDYPPAPTIGVDIDIEFGPAMGSCPE